jgi:[ribosomal protein S5]-alanine N-acetyltransferase
MTIETTRLKLLQCDTNLLEAAITGNDRFAAALGVTVPDNWTEFGLGPVKYALKQLEENPDSIGWWTYFPIHKKDRKLIGSGGYKGIPTPDGEVEIGYEIAPDYRNLGLATEMAMGLVAHAFNHEYVKLVLAHTLAYENTSTSVLRKCGFKKMDEINDPDDGLIWKWGVKKV